MQPEVKPSAVTNNWCMTPPLQKHGRGLLEKILEARPNVTTKRAKKGLNQFLLWQMIRLKRFQRTKWLHMHRLLLIFGHKRWIPIASASLRLRIWSTTLANFWLVPRASLLQNWCGIVFLALKEPNMCVWTWKFLSHSFPWLFWIYEDANYNISGLDCYTI